MRLLIDAGNTRIKWAVAKTFDDEILFSGIVFDDWSELAEFTGMVESAWVSCVASESVLAGIKAKITKLFAITANVAKVSECVAGMVNEYETLDKLGVDRWVAALGARSIVSYGALIVVDAGTAVTIDLISDENHFEGGVILPGFVTMHDSLLERTAGIESYRTPVASIIGKNTRDCVNAGVQYGLVGAVDRIVSEICATVSGDSPRLLAMGGDAHAIVEASGLEFELQSDMIFYGLMLLSKT